MTAKQWSQLVREHSPLVWRTSYRLLAHQADAADCMQETFISAWKLVQRQSIKNWPGLLQRIATSRALDQLRRRKRFASQTESNDLGELPSPEKSPVALAQSTELAEQLRAALADLPPPQGELYCLRHLNGLSYEEMAAELDMTVSAVGVALHRASRRLRVALQPVVVDGHEPGRPL